MEDNIVLTMRGICMTFPGVKALDNVDFTLRKGEIHALMGETARASPPSSSALPVSMILKLARFG